MHFKWRKQMMIFTLRASTGFIVALPTAYACRSADSNLHRLREIKALVD
jgi:hypothetical protein